MTDVQDNAATQAAGPQVSVLGQYVKDLSFENPGVASPQQMQQRPQIQVSIDVQVRPIANDQFEVSLRTNIEAKSGEATAYVVELVYAGMFSLRNLPPEGQQPFLLIECPRMLFPFARRIIADVTRDGGYQPLMLDPIDFSGLYRAQLERQRAAQASGQSGTA